MSSLFERFFLQPLEQERNEEEAQQEELGSLASFVRHRYFEKLMLDYRDMEDRAKPRPGAESEMVYAIGVRDGIERARLHLESLIRFVQEHYRE